MVQDDFSVGGRVVCFLEIVEEQESILFCGSLSSFLIIFTAYKITKRLYNIFNCNIELLDKILIKIKIY